MISLPSHRHVPALFLALCVPLVAMQAQSSPSPEQAAYGSRYLSMEHWANDAVTELRRRGYLGALDPLAQPYHRIEVARAVAALGPDTLPQPVSYWVKLLRQELAPELARLAGTDSVQVGYQILAGATTSTSRRLDPLLPWRHPEEGTHLTNRFWPDYGVGGWFERGRFAGEVRLFHPLYDEKGGNGDPDGRDPGGIVVLNRTDNAYLETRFSLGDFFVGRMARNWGPIGSTGLMISNNPTTYPQIGLDLGTSRFGLRFFAAELDTLSTTNPGVQDPVRGAKRYLVAHELEYHTPNFGISVGEANLYVSSAGPLINSLNPLELYFFEQDIEPQSGVSNTVVNGKLWLQRGGLLATGEALLDDIHVDNTAPVRGGLSGGVQYVGVAPWLELGADYRIVTSLAYWTFSSLDQWDYYHRGLGDPFSDYDRLTLHASIFPRVPGLRLTPTLAYQRKGEGDYRTTLVTTDSAFHHTKSLFLGVRENTARLALAGRYQPVRWLFADWDGGVNFVDNANHVAGRKLTEFQGVARLGITLEGRLDQW